MRVRTHFLVLAQLLPEQRSTAQHATCLMDELRSYNRTCGAAYVGTAGGVGLAAGGADRVDHLLALGGGDPRDVLADGGVGVAADLGAEVVPEGDALVAGGVARRGAGGGGVLNAS